MDVSKNAKTSVRTLYHDLLDAWNQHNAAAFAALFKEEAHVIGFDGSQMEGREEVERTLAQIFSDHVTAAYVAKVRGVEMLSPGAALLRAVVGMVPPGQRDINPAVNAVQTMVATLQGSTWHIVLFQSTPAQFHGRPELAAALTEELRDLL